MEVIVPAAGLSTRYPGGKPKYLLEDINQSLMIENTLKPYYGKFNITVGVLQDHNEKYNAVAEIKNRIKDINVVVIPNLTKGPADTVFNIIQLSKFNLEESLFIKDCDSYFDHVVERGNYVCTHKITNLNSGDQILNKSFVLSNNHKIIQNIVEKQIISDEFCVGGYKFDKISEFLSSYNSLINQLSTEFFVSHVIQHSINKGNIFKSVQTTNYVDVGTINEWAKRRA